jgi:peptidoglycan/LPS O-acetylase OafA/YrhL
METSIQQTFARALKRISAIRLRRITSSVAYIPEIDGIRFFAIVSVVIFHIAGDVINNSPTGYARQISADPVYWISGHLGFGVNAFFVVSGFVLALPFARHYLLGSTSPTLKKYFLRRLTRLEPPYILAMLYFFALNVLRGRGTFVNQMEHLLASVLYQHNLIYGRPSDILMVACHSRLKFSSIFWRRSSRRSRFDRAIEYCGAPGF